MERLASRAYRARRLAIVVLFASSILLFMGYSDLLTAGRAGQASWRFEIEEGRKTRLSISINNSCSEPHHFGINSQFKYLSFAPSAEGVLIGPDSSELANFEFDATGLESSVYRDTVIVDCLDCKTEPGCRQDRDELLVEMSVVESTSSAEPDVPGLIRSDAGAADDASDVSDVSNVPACTPPPGGMVSWWTMDGSLTDILHTNNQVSSSGVSFVPGRVERGVTFSVPGRGFIEIPQSASLSNQAFTLDAWVRADGPGPNDNDEFGSVIIVKNVVPGNQSAGLLWNFKNRQFRFIFGNIYTERIVSKHQFAAGQFHHVAATYDGKTFRLYVNGQSEGEFASHKTVAYSSIPWAIGSSAAFARLHSFPRTWNGVIDEVEIFSRALSLCEIQAIFIAGSAGKCKPPA